jgi:threonyl-tRNA synthetase
MAEAVQELWPGTQVTIGPVIENGFYYDFKRNEPFTTEDLPVIEKKMREIIAQQAVHQGSVEPRQGQAGVSRQGRGLQGRADRRDPDEQDLKIYHQGDWFDLCRGPHMATTGQIGTGFKLMKVAGAYWRGDSEQRDADPHLRHRVGHEADLEGYLHMLEEAEKRDHRKLGREMDLFHFQEEGPGVVFWHAKGWRMFQNLVNYMRRRLEGTYEEVNAPQVLDKALWETSGHWGWYKENMFVTETEDDTRVRHQADELPRPCADLQARAEILSRPADPAGRVRQCAPL